MRSPGDLLSRRASGPAQPAATILILTPVKDAADCVDGYCGRIRGLTYPRRPISLGFLESDSGDGAYERLGRHLRRLRSEFRRARLWKRDFGCRIRPGLPRWHSPIQ